MFRGRTDEDFHKTNFVNADPKVVADFTARRKVDPCGLALLAQRALFSGSGDLTSELLPDTGHMLALERTAPQLQRIVSDWLERHGF